MILKLVVIQGRPPGKQLFFGPGEYYLGRGPECQVRFNTDWISRQHCLLRVEPGQVLLRDLSRNGTLVNGTLIAGDQLLKSGDQVQIGPVVFQVELVVSETVVKDPGSSSFFRDSNSTDPGSAEVSLESTAERVHRPR
ncbi:MAG: FHA domain-containing protein, partial [Gemmataceae bacterium]